MSAPAVEVSIAQPVSRTPVVYRPESAVFWVYVAALTIGSYVLVTSLGQAFHETMDAHLQLGAIWAAFLAGLVWLILRFDPFRSVRPYPQGLVAGTALGGTVATVMAMNGNGALQGVLGRVLDPDVLTRWSAALTAPVIEESSKGLCAVLILVLCAAVFHRISHALLVGMFVGLGFDISEDLLYSTKGALSSLDSDIAGASGDLGVRIFTAIPSHWAFTSLFAVGALLLLPTFAGRSAWPRGRRMATAAVLMASAWFMHFFWDAPVSDDAGLAAMLGKMAVNLALFLLLTTWLLRDERRWVADRIEAGRRIGHLESDDAIVDSLLTRRRRRRLQRQARRSTGRSAAKSVRLRQRAALDDIQASDW